MRKFFLFIAFLPFVFSIYLQPETTKTTSTEKPLIYADKWKSNDDKIIYSGNVEVKFGIYQIFADYIEYERKTKTIHAKGRVSLNTDTISISGEELVFNLKDKSGSMYKNYGNILPSVRFSTEKLHFINRDLTVFSKMDFTSCSQRVPRWNISCSKGKIKRNKYIQMNNAVLKIKKIPFFYFPYIRYPIRKGGKATGFLFPQFGTGGKKGLYIQNAFFLNLKSNLDITLFSDYFSKAGYGTGEEFRYLFKNMSGNIKFYYFKYKKDNEIKPNGVSDYYIDAQHYSAFDFLQTKIKVDIKTQSDPTFLRLFSNSFDTSLFANFRTSFSLNSKISFLNLSVNASKRETYYTYRESSRIIKYMPSLRLTMYQKKIWKIPGYFSFNTVFERVSRSGVSYEDEPEFTKEFISQRFNIIPSYTLNLIKLPWLSTTVNLKSYQSFYPKSYLPNTRTVVDEPLHLSYHTAEITLKGPVFYKFMKFAKGKLKHIIEPQIYFKYSSKIDDEDLSRLIKVDRFDFPQFSVLGAKFTTNLLYKSNKEDSTPREILRLTLGQRYFFDPALASWGRKINGEYPVFSEFSTSLVLNFTKNISLSSSLAYNHYLKKFQRIGVYLLFSCSDSILTGKIGYTSYTSPYMPPDFYFNRDMITGGLVLNIPDFPIKLNTAVSYDITEKKFRYGSAITQIDLQCIKIKLEFKVFSNILGTYPQFRFGFSLGNMGALSTMISGKK